MNTPTTETGEADWLITAVQDVVDAVGRAAVRRDEDQVHDDTLQALRGFDHALNRHCASGQDTINAYWVLASGLAYIPVSAAGLLGHDLGAEGTVAVLRVVDRGTSQVVDDPDAEVSTPDERALVAMGRLITAAANEDPDTAQAVFAAALHQPDGEQITAAMITMLARTAGQAIAQLLEAVNRA